MYNRISSLHFVCLFTLLWYICLNYKILNSFVDNFIFLSWQKKKKNKNKSFFPVVNIKMAYFLFKKKCVFNMCLKRNSFTIFMFSSPSFNSTAVSSIFRVLLDLFWFLFHSMISRILYVREPILKSQKERDENKTETRQM